MNQFVNYQWRNSTKIIRETLRENANLNKEEPGKGLRDFYKKLKQKETIEELINQSELREFLSEFWWIKSLW